MARRWRGRSSFIPRSSRTSHDPDAAAGKTRRPALAIAGEVKLPTARNSRIGSGKADYTVYGIGSKRMGRWETHLNVGYTLIGRPAGTRVSNVQIVGLAEELQATARFDVVGEMTGSTAALSEGGGGLHPGVAMRW